MAHLGHPVYRQAVKRRFSDAACHSRVDVAKILSARMLQRAEVVELADTPSQAVALLVICKLLMATVASMSSITYPESPQKPPASPN